MATSSLRMSVRPDETVLARLRVKEPVGEGESFVPFVMVVARLRLCGSLLWVTSANQHTEDKERDILAACERSVVELFDGGSGLASNPRSSGSPKDATRS